MISRYRNIRNSDLAIVASAQFDAPFRNVFYHHHTFCLLAGSLQNQIVPLGLLYGEHLDCLTTLSFYYDRELSLTDLALEFLEVVMKSASNDLFLDFYADPLQHALQMNSATGPRTLAGIEKEVVLLLSVFQTYFASFLLSLRRFFLRQVLHDEFIGVQFFFVALGSGDIFADADFADEEFDSAELDGLSWFCVE